MFDSPDNSTDHSELKDFESMLAQLAPKPSSLCEEELFYQAGFAAKTGVMPVSVSHQRRGSGSSRLVLAFGGGLSAGIAASWCLLMGLGLMRPTNNEGDIAVVAQESHEVSMEKRDESIVLDRESVADDKLLEPFDWDENSIRTVIYRGSRRAIWESQSNESSSAEKSSDAVSAEEKAQVDNLNWRRQANEMWLD